MKKALVIGGVIAVAAVAVWSALWFAGRGQIEDRLELETARAEARGMTITWGARTIGGFPFGYDIDATEVALIHRESGVLVRIPRLSSRLDASAVQEVETHLIGEITVNLPISERNREADPRLPPVVKLMLDGDALRLVARGVTGTERSLVLLSDEFRMKVEQDDIPNRLSAVISALNATYSDTGGKRVSAVQASSVDFRADGTDAGGQEAEVTVNIAALNLTGTADLPETANLNEVIFGGKPGSVELVYTTGRLDSSATAVDATGEGGGSFTYSGASTTGIVGMGSGRVEFQGESRENRWTVEPRQPTSPVRGTMTAEAVQTRYSMPTGVSETPQPGSLRLAMIRLDGDDSFWNNLDPKAVLDRSPAELLLDVEATAKLTGRIDRLGPTEPFPVQLANVSVNGFDVRALGGEMSATGDVEVLQPINLPLGALDIRINKGNAVLSALTQAGLIDETTRSMAAAMLQVYARPIDEDTHETDLTFGNEGITMNGLRIQ
ncbi:MAG: DUF2125 domain-containing protein [Pseudomonadota bacterium]